MDQFLYRYNKPPKCNLWEIYAIDRDGRQKQAAGDIEASNKTRYY